MGDLSPYYDHYQSLLDILNDGDLIEFPNNLYSHWAVYIGNGEVIHLTGAGNPGANSSIRSDSMFSISGVLFSKAKVCIQNLREVFKPGTKARKNNSRDQDWRPLSRSEIVRNAISKVGHVGYNILFSNCENFAKWCRYGLSKSDQVDNVLTGAAVGLAALGLGALVYAAASRSNENEEEEKQKVAANK